MRGFRDRILSADPTPDTFVTWNPNSLSNSATPRAPALLKNSKGFAVSLLQPQPFSQHAWSRIQQFPSPDGSVCPRRATKRWTLVSIRLRIPHRPRATPLFPQISSISIMTEKYQRPRGRDGTLPSLDIAIDALNLAKGATSVIPAKAAFTSASLLLVMIRVGLIPVHVCRLLNNVYRTRWSTKWTMSN